MAMITKQQYLAHEKRERKKPHEHEHHCPVMVENVAVYYTSVRRNLR